MEPLDKVTVLLIVLYFTTSLPMACVLTFLVATRTLRPLVLVVVFLLVWLLHPILLFWLLINEGLSKLTSR